MKTFKISSPKDFEPFCLKIIQKEYPSTIILKGDLGAGKTTFVRTFISLLDSEILVSSPTFTLMNIYKTNPYTIHHFDLYRLNNSYEATEWGFDEFVVDCDFSFIEWAERAIDLIPSNHTLITIEHGAIETERFLSISSINNP